MITDGPLIVQLAYPGIEKLVDVTRVAGVDERVETVLCPYIDSTELRTAKRLEPDSEALRAEAPKLSDAQIDAVSRAEVLFRIDARELYGLENG